VSGALEVGPRLGDPAAETIATMLTTSPDPQEMTEDAERLVFSD